MIGANPGADYFTSDGKSIVSAPIDGRFCNEGEYELIQFTGLKDKNGKEIYEGDIVKWFVNDVIRTGIVDYIDGYGGFDMKNFKDDYHVCCDWLRGEYEVIGNIYENPELQ